MDDIDQTTFLDDDEDWSKQWQPSAATGGNKQWVKQEAKSEAMRSGTDLQGKVGDVHACSNSGQHIVSNLELNDNKAGMVGLDKEKINNIIFEVSKGSKFYENEQRRNEKMKLKIAEQDKRFKELSAADIELGEKAADALLFELEQHRDDTRTIVHIDMDAFYVAVEIRDQPSLRDKPVAVGGTQMLCTSNYVARRFGVRAAMPGFIGLKLCPDLVILRPHFDKYTAVSKEVRAVLREYDPDMCPIGLDEAYLDITAHLATRVDLPVEKRTFPTYCGMYQLETPKDTSNSDGSLADSITFGVTADEAVREMRHRVLLTTSLTASAGIASNLMLAKVCSDKNKPNGQFRIESSREEVLAFIRDLPVRKISGIGKVAESLLRALGVVTCSDLQRLRGVLYHLYSQISFDYFMRISLGIGSTRVERDDGQKSISCEQTFGKMVKPSDMFEKCADLCEELSREMEEKQIVGKTVTVKMKTVDFVVMTRASSLPNHTRDKEVMYRTAKDILQHEIRSRLPEPLMLRLMGVRMSNLLEDHEVGSTANSSCGKGQQSVLQCFGRMKASDRSTSHFTDEDGESSSSSRDSSVADSNKTTANSFSGVFKVATADPAAKCSPSVQPTSQSTPATAVSSEGDANKTNAVHSFGLPSFDSEPQSENSLTELSNSRSISETIYSCPICNTVVDCDSLASLNKHIDECLAYSTIDNSVHGNIVASNDYPNFADSPHKGQGHSIPGSVSASSKAASSASNVTSSSITSKKNSEKTPASSSSANLDSSASTSSSAAEKTADGTCPVCGKLVLAESLNDFNEHLDFCLNRSLIQKIVSEENSRSTSATPRREPQNKVQPSSAKKKDNLKRPATASASASGKEQNKRSNVSQTGDLRLYQTKQPANRTPFQSFKPD